MVSTVRMFSVWHHGERYHVLYIHEDAAGKISYCCASDGEGKKIWIKDEEIEMMDAER